MNMAAVSAGVAATIAAAPVTTIALGTYVGYVAGTITYFAITLAIKSFKELKESKEY
jgi:hypothetical protein